MLYSFNLFFLKFRKIELNYKKLQEIPKHSLNVLQTNKTQTHPKRVDMTRCLKIILLLKRSRKEYWEDLVKAFCLLKHINTAGKQEFFENFLFICIAFIDNCE